MAEGEDSRPFLVLKKNAEDFKAVFDRDIQVLLDTLDSKLTDLLRNPESLATSAGGAKRLNAHMEFSKAKLDIFVTLKDRVVDMADQWADHLGEIRDTFVENVEIFLAGTKLEVKEDTSSSSRKSLSLKERKKLQSSTTPVSFLYPKILDTAMNIPVLNNLLPKTDVQSNASEPQNVGASPLLKPIRKQSALPELDSPGPGRRKNSVRFAEVENTENVEMVEEEEESSDSEVEIVEAPVVVKRGRGRPPANSSAASKQTSLGKAIAVKALQDEVSEAAEKFIADAVESRGGRGSRRGPATPSSANKSQASVQANNGMEISSDSSISGEEAAVKPRTRRGAHAKAEEPITPRAKAKRGAKTSVAEEVVTPVKGTPGRRGRRVAEPVVTPPKPVETSPSPKTKNFPHGLDLTEDLEIFSPVVNISRSAPRRKTVILQDLGFTPEVPKPKSKRKTIGCFLNLSSGTPSKRLKMSGRSSLAPEEMEVQESDDSDHLEGDNSAATGGNYTPWVPLSEVSARVPAEPGVYELKVSQAKKPAYIGACESLRHRLTLHRLRHASCGHKHLDKFVERNAANLLVRYERTDSPASAAALEKQRVADFAAAHNTTPAYN